MAQVNDNLYETGDLISLKEASEISGLSTGHLRLLVRNKVIWGIKIGRNWITARQEIEEYLKEERKTGPKPR